MPENESRRDRPQAFICYARKDKNIVLDLYGQLKESGILPWIDVRDILPGMLWDQAITRAARESDFFLACLSGNSINRRGFIQREIKIALDQWTERLDSDIYLIPVRLEECSLPEELGQFQCLDLFAPEGFSLLVRAIQTGWSLRFSSLVEPLAEALSVYRRGTETLAVRVIKRAGLAIIQTFGFINNQGGETIAQTCAQLQEQGYKNFLLDCKGTKIINSIGISILIELIELSIEIDGSLSFVNLTPTISQTFHIMGLSQYAPIFPDMETALVALSRRIAGWSPGTHPRVASRPKRVSPAS